MKREHERAEIITWKLWLGEKSILVVETGGCDDGGWGDHGYGSEKLEGLQCGIALDLCFRT